MTTKATTHAGNLHRRPLLKAAAAAVLSSGLAIPALAQRPRALRFGSPMPTDSTYQHAMEIFAKELAQLSGGRMKVQLYPNSQLGGIPDMLTAVQLGTQSMVIAVPSWYSSFVKQMDVFALPFITSSPQRLRTALDGELGKRTQSFAGAAGFHIMGYWFAGAREFYNNLRPIHTPADMRGMKLRSIASPVFLESFRAMGADPVALDYSEVYLALQQHTVDGFDNGLTDVLTGKYYEVCKYASITNHVIDFFVASMNKGLWDSFSANEQMMIDRAMKKATDWQWEAQTLAIAKAEKTVRHKMQTNDISPQDREEFVQVTRPVYTKFESSIGKDMIDLAIRELGHG